MQSFQELRDMAIQERFDLLVKTAGFSASQVNDIELVLEMIPSITIEVVCQTDGEEGIREDDFVTAYAWVTLKRGNGLKGVLPHAPHFPFYKEENFWLLLADQARNEVWMAHKVNFMDEATAIRSATKVIGGIQESLGATSEEVTEAMQSVAERIRRGSRQLIGKFLAPQAGTYNLTAHCLCDSWIGCDSQTNLTVEVLKKCQTGSKDHVMRTCCSHHHAPKQGPVADAKNDKSEYEEEEIDDDNESEYSEDNEDKEKEEATNSDVHQAVDS